MNKLKKNTSNKPSLLFTSTRPKPINKMTYSLVNKQLSQLFNDDNHHYVLGYN